MKPNFSTIIPVLTILLVSILLHYTANDVINKSLWSALALIISCFLYGVTGQTNQLKK